MSHFSTIGEINIGHNIATILRSCLRLPVHVPLPGYVNQPFAAVPPFYQRDKEKDITKAVNLVRAQIMNLQEYDWKKLVKVLEEVTTKKG